VRLRVIRNPSLTRALLNAYWAEQGLTGIADPDRRFRDAERTARCGPRRWWCGGHRGEPDAYPINC
jgi:hypothetical protein